MQPTKQMNQQNLTIEDKLKKALSVFPEIKLAILFGSFATGKQTESSDIDVAVAAKEVLSFDRKMKIIDAIVQVVARPVDLIDLQQKQEPILTQVITKGKKLFCYDTALYAELIKTVVFDAEDFLPMRARILKERREKWLSS